MIAYPHINPEIVRIGPIALRWYGAMYAIGFAASYWLVRYQIQHPVQGKPGSGDLREFPENFLDNFYVYLIAGLVVGARLGYVLFYDLRLYLADPFELLCGLARGHVVSRRPDRRSCGRHLVLPALPGGPFPHGGPRVSHCAHRSWPGQDRQFHQR